MAIELKKIAPGVFRELKDDEGRILFLRHGDHQNNILTPLAAHLLTDQGTALKAAGITIDAAISSPADRAIASTYFTKVGLGGGYTSTSDALRDLSGAKPEVLQKLKSGAQDAKLSIEEFCFALCRTDDNWRELMMQRGREGANALQAAAQPGKTILAVSHGGARIEISIASLQGLEALTNILDNGPEVFLATGQIAEVIINTKLGSIPAEVNYFEPPKIDPGAMEL